MSKFALLIVSVVVFVGCSGSSNNSSSSGSSGGTSGSPGPLAPLPADAGSLCTLTDGGAAVGSAFSCDITCEFFGAEGTYAYTCPTQAEALACADDVIPCTPTDSTRGAVALGQTCRNDLSDGSAANDNDELADNCAPIQKYVDAFNPKGTVCVTSITIGATNNSNYEFCSHACRTNSDCTDIVIPNLDSSSTLYCNTDSDRCELQ